MSEWRVGPNGIDMRPGCRICGDHYIDAPHGYESEDDAVREVEKVVARVVKEHAAALRWLADK